ncbi:N-6 DNA methylase [Microbispora hainanensis]|uniref:type ISP restriction/modification enzyme n=1 Tax=Microbispora hainanensis TaxID=568844 RepID=UPI002E2AE1A0|nr:type ISP restriction/modification enzyme [Microbispora hainanensis]
MTMRNPLRTGESPESTARSSERDTLPHIVADFRRQVARKLGRGGNPEDQLRAPLEVILQRLGTRMGLRVTPYGEVPLHDIGSRPDYAVDVERSRVGYIELKAPGRSVPESPTWRASERERRQCERLRELPNLIYSDGTDWIRYQNGVPGKVVRLNGSDASLTAFDALIREFLLWAPDPPRSVRDLIRVTSGLCRLLRDTVAELLEAERTGPEIGPFTHLAQDWRALLFPALSNNEFADAYAQTVTFSLLLAREAGIDFTDHDLVQIAKQLGKQHPLLGSALSHLAEPLIAQQLTILDTLRVVIGAADWNRLPKTDRTSYWDLYELFLQEYDPELRKKSGAYYTPEPVARFMVDFVDHILKTRMRTNGFADKNVVALDPAMGTGTFLMEIIRSVADTIAAEDNALAVRDHLGDLCRYRLIGFERSAGPFAVAELRLHQTLRETYRTDIPEDGLRFLIDTLDDPNGRFIDRGLAYNELQRARDRANKIKRETPIVVVIGNPPYLERARQQDPAPWIERRRDPGYLTDLRFRPSLDEFRLPEHSRLAYKLANTATYFWRWATWKVFDANPEHPAGIVAFITTSAYLSTEAFAGMRKYLRETTDEGWIIDLSPEHHQPPQSTRVFRGVQQPICIGIFARYGSPDRKRPATVHYTALHGKREEKFEAMAAGIPLDAAEQWQECPAYLTAPFMPVAENWLSLPPLLELMPWHEPGVKANRTWVCAPSPEVLERRWRRLVAEGFPDDLFKRTRDLAPTSLVAGLPPLADATALPRITPYAFRSFDRQFLFEDPRVIDYPRQPLWDVRGARQIYVSTQHGQPLSSGPGLTFTENVPDQHHFNGRGGRVVPLYRDQPGVKPNVAPGLLQYLGERLDRRLTAEDLLAYIAGTVAHPAYTARFRDQLAALHGIRVPLTADARLWDAAAELGREVIWLHTSGTRFQDGDSPGRPRLSADRRPRRVSWIPDGVDDMPDEISYDPATRMLRLGNGVIAPVDPRAYAYDVGGRPVIKSWFSYRQRTRPRTRTASSPLDDIRNERWTTQFTEELLDLIQVLTLLADLHPLQEALLDRILDGPLITTADLTAARLLPVPSQATKAPLRSGRDDTLF